MRTMTEHALHHRGAAVDTCALCLGAERAKYQGLLQEQQQQIEDLLIAVQSEVDRNADLRAKAESQFTSQHDESQKWIKALELRLEEAKRAASSLEEAKRAADKKQAAASADAERGKRALEEKQEALAAERERARGLEQTLQAARAAAATDLRAASKIADDLRLELTAETLKSKADYSAAIKELGAAQKSIAVSNAHHQLVSARLEKAEKGLRDACAGWGKSEDLVADLEGRLRVSLAATAALETQLNATRVRGTELDVQLQASLGQRSLLDSQLRDLRAVTDTQGARLSTLQAKLTAAQGRLDAIAMENLDARLAQRHTNLVSTYPSNDKLQEQYAVFMQTGPRQTLCELWEALALCSDFPSLRAETLATFHTPAHSEPFLGLLGAARRAVPNGREGAVVELEVLLGQVILDLLELSGQRAGDWERHLQLAFAAWCPPDLFRDGRQLRATPAGGAPAQAAAAAAAAAGPAAEGAAGSAAEGGARGPPAGLMTAEGKAGGASDADARLGRVWEKMRATLERNAAELLRAEADPLLRLGGDLRGQDMPLADRIRRAPCVSELRTLALFYLETSPMPIRVLLERSEAAGFLFCLPLAFVAAHSLPASASATLASPAPPPAAVVEPALPGASVTEPPAAPPTDPARVSAAAADLPGPASAQNASPRRGEAPTGAAPDAAAAAAWSAEDVPDEDRALALSALEQLESFVLGLLSLMWRIRLSMPQIALFPARRAAAAAAGLAPTAADPSSAEAGGWAKWLTAARRPDAGRHTGPPFLLYPALVLCADHSLLLRGKAL
jgi:hypothetical protein